MADRGLITTLTSAILSNMGPHLKTTHSESSDSAFSSQNQPAVNPGVSDDQTGMASNQVNPGVSDDQTGAESQKWAAEESADSEIADSEIVGIIRGGKRGRVGCYRRGICFPQLALGGQRGTEYLFRYY